MFFILMEKIFNPLQAPLDSMQQLLFFKFELWVQLKAIQTNVMTIYLLGSTQSCRAQYL